jgi:hypothetical protein
MKNNRRQPSRSLRDVLNRVKRFLMPWIEPTEPEDPYAYCMAPLRPPPSRGGAAAVAELDIEGRDDEQSAGPPQAAILKHSIDARDQSLGGAAIVFVIASEGQAKRGLLNMDAIQDCQRGRNEGDRAAGPCARVKRASQEDELQA